MLIAQLTDTHIKPAGRMAYGRVDTKACLLRAIAHLNGLSPQVDVVIISGDLTDAGSVEEYVLLKECLSELTAPYYLIPGNHDSREGLVAVFDDHAYLRDDDGGFLHYVIDDYPLCLIGLDTTVPGKPHGRLCKTRLAWLREQLAERANRPILMFMHHPPFLTGITHMDRQNLQEPELFLALVTGHPNIRHVACGHVHRACETVIGGVPFSIAPNAAHAVTLALSPDAPSSFTLEPPAVRLFAYDDADARRGGQVGSIVSHLSYIGDFDGPHPFYDPSGALID